MSSGDTHLQFMADQIQAWKARAEHAEAALQKFYNAECESLDCPYEARMKVAEEKLQAALREREEAQEQLREVCDVARSVFGVEAVGSAKAFTLELVAALAAAQQQLEQEHSRSDWPEFIVAAFNEGWAAKESKFFTDLADAWEDSHAKMELDAKGQLPKSSVAELLALRLYHKGLYRFNSGFVMAESLSEHYAAILKDLRSRYERAKVMVRDLEADIGRIERLAGQYAPLHVLINENVSVHEADDGSGEALVVTMLPKPDFSRMSVRWAVLWLLSDYESAPQRTSEIASALLAGGYKSGSDTFPNAVSAVLSGMKTKGEVDGGADGYVITEKGKQTWQLIRQGAKFREAISSNAPTLLSAQ